MVARDGIEPPTPAFSGLIKLIHTITYTARGNCQVPPRTCKTGNKRVGDTGWIEAGAGEGSHTDAGRRPRRTPVGELATDEPPAIRGLR
jgi:hypothetical protein